MRHETYVQFLFLKIVMGLIVMKRLEAWIAQIMAKQESINKECLCNDVDTSSFYTQGIDIKTAVPFNAQAFVDQIQATATINETEGYVTGVNSLFIQQTMTDYQTQVQNYITQTYPNATVGDVLGKKDIVKQEFPVLLGTLPYKMVVKGATYSSLPDSLRQKITFSVIKDIYDDLGDTPINITKNLPELAGKKITLSYSPATQADENVINKYLPKPHTDGTPIQPSELPTSLPAYLINVKPELRVDGVVVATGTVVGLGQAETFGLTFSAPNKSPEKIEHFVKSGEYFGIAIDQGRISADQMQKLKTKLEATKAKLEAQDFTTLTKDDILGDLLYTTALSYFAELDMMNYVQSKTTGVESIRLPSESAFSLKLNTYSVFGIPQSVSAEGLAMDVARNISAREALNGDNSKKVQFVLSAGMTSSALEHSVPEQLFSTPENPAHGVSAVKALQLANEQGIPIYTINQSNIAATLPQLQVDADVKADIQNAVNAGKEVTVSKTNINYNGWTGYGYIVIDPTTGEGAYMINGGMNGALILAIICMTNPTILISILFLWLVVNNINTILGTFVEMIKVSLCAPNPMFMYASNYLICKAFFGDQAALEYYKCLYDIILGEAAEAVVDETITLSLIASLGLEVGKKVAKRISLVINIVSSVDDIISYGKCNYNLVQ